MNAGIIQVGNRVRFTKPLTIYHTLRDIPVGATGTVEEIIAQNEGAEADVVTIRPDGWPALLCCVFSTDGLELLP